jgi:hypothetical protein
MTRASYAQHQIRSPLNSRDERTLPLSSASTSAVHDRPLPPPIYCFGEFAAWTRCLARLVGRLTSLLFPVHRLLVAAMLRFLDLSVLDDRDLLMVALTPICCLRVSELLALQICHLWFDFHAGYGIPGFLGTLAIHIARRKNDCELKGHHPAVGRAIDPDHDLVHQLKVWLCNHCLRVSPLCQK